MARQAQSRDIHLDLHQGMQKLLLFSLVRESSVAVLQRLRRRVHLQSQQLRQLRERELMQRQEEEQQDLQLQRQCERQELLAKKLSCIRQDLQLSELIRRCTEAGYRFVGSGDTVELFPRTSSLQLSFASAAHKPEVT